MTQELQPGRYIIELQHPAKLHEATPAENHVAAIRQTLRSCCEEFGCNDWPDNLHLSDVIEKHLMPAIRDELEGLTSSPGSGPILD